VLTIATSGATPLGKKQKRFNSLVKTASQLRESLRAWRDSDYQLARAGAAHDALIDQRRAAIRALVILFDGYAGDLVFTKIERKQLAAVVTDFARDLLSFSADAELKEIYNRHTRSDFDVERAEEQAEQSRAIQDVLEDHGYEFDRQFDSLEDLEAAAAAQREERDHTRAGKKKSRKQIAAEERKTAAQLQAGKVLQEVYRQLVRALHPDHEQDPAERARKTALMQDVNVAYERADLLALLELQLRFEQLDSAQISGIAEDRLDHFIALLNEQVRQLRDELAAVEHHYRIQLDVFPPRKLPIAYVLACIREDTDTLAHDVARMQHDLKAFRDPASVKAWLRDQRDRASRSARELTELLSMVGSAQRRRR
jgi:hypothetical protein